MHPAGTVDLTPIFTYLNQGVLLLLTGLAAWMVSYLRAWLIGHIKFLDKSTDNQIAAALDQALKAGTVYAMNTITAEEKANSDVPVNGMLARMAAQYAINHAPASAAHFGLDENKLVDMALARLPVVSTTEDVAAASAAAMTPARVTTAPLPPVTPAPAAKNEDFPP